MSGAAFSGQTAADTPFFPTLASNSPTLGAHDAQTAGFPVVRLAGYGGLGRSKRLASRLQGVQLSKLSAACARARTVSR